MGSMRIAKPSMANILAMVSVTVFIVACNAPDPDTRCGEPPRQRPRLHCIVHQRMGIADPVTQCSNESIDEYRKFSDLAVLPVESSRLHGSQNVADLILSRMGIFDSDHMNLDQYHICNDHYNELGPDRRAEYRTGRKKKIGCAIRHLDIPPVHDQPTFAAKRRYLQKEESRTLWSQRNIFIPLGTPLCPRHSKDIKSLVATKAHPRPATGENSTNDQTDDDDTIVDTLDFTWVESSDDDTISNDEDPTIVFRQTRNLLLQIGRLNSVSNLHSSDIFGALKDSTQIRRAGAVTRLINVIYEALAPDSPEILRDLVEKRQTRRAWHRKKSKEFVQLAESIADAYSTAKTRTERLLTLSIIAPLLSHDEIQSYIPGLTEYAFKRARLYGKMKREGHLEPNKDLAKRTKYNERRVHSFIDFITSPLIVSDMPFGHVSLKRTGGVKQEVPSLVRQLVNERIVQQYTSYLQEHGVETEAALNMSRTTYLRILKICQAKTRKTMAGLDYFVYNGAEAIDALTKLVEDLRTMDGDIDFAKEASKGLREARNFLKGTYKIHVAPQTATPDYCIAYALSDPNKPEFQAHGHDHQHNGRCYECESLNQTLESIKDKIRELNWPNDRDKVEALYIWDESTEAILEWKKHLVRTRNQDNAKDEILTELRSNEVHLTLDWAMKFLPLQGSESQTGWFGKRGVSWHITVAIIRQARGGYFQRTFVHVFDNAGQDAEDVVAILQDTLVRINEERPEITKAYIRSDNAGCYHGSESILSVPVVSAKQRVKIMRWDFSDPQSGKGPCDRAAALIKRHVRLYAAEKNKCTNADEFVKCANSYDGVKGMTFILAGLASVNVRIRPLQSVSLYNNFQFESRSMRVWKAFDIGPGKVIKYDGLQLPDSLPTLRIDAVYSAGREIYRRQEGQQADVVQGLHRRTTLFWKTILGDSYRGVVQQCQARDLSVTPEDEQCIGHDNGIPDDDAISNAEIEATEKKLFPCPEDGCVMTYQYQKNLDRHMRVGNHVRRAERQTLRDFAIDHYAQQIDRLMLSLNFPSIASAIASNAAVEQADQRAAGAPKMGWALRSTKPSKRFTEAQRQYLISKFDEGITTGRKHTPQDIAKQMRRDFPNRQDWLTGQQIQSFWSNEARRREKNVQAPVTEAGPPEELADDPIMNMIDIHVNEVIEAVRAQRTAQSAPQLTTESPEDEELNANPFED